MRLLSCFRGDDDGDAITGTARPSSTTPLRDTDARTVTSQSDGAFSVDATTSNLGTEHTPVPTYSSTSRDGTTSPVIRSLDVPPGYKPSWARPASPNAKQPPPRYDENTAGPSHLPQMNTHSDDSSSQSDDGSNDSWDCVRPPGVDPDADDYDELVSVLTLCTARRKQNEEFWKEHLKGRRPFGRIEERGLEEDNETAQSVIERVLSKFPEARFGALVDRYFEHNKVDKAHCWSNYDMAEARSKIKSRTEAGSNREEQGSLLPAEQGSSSTTGGT